MNMILSILAPVLVTALGFVAAVSAGAARDADGVAPINPLAALLISAVFLVLQAVLWVRLGVKLGDA